MTKLWYGADEVRDFHPVVEESLNKALDSAKLSHKYKIVHHLGDYTRGIPDFSVLDKTTGDFVCIIEVKKKPSDVFFKESGLQAMGYVKDLQIMWKPKFYTYFCVTNIELTQFYSLREKASLIGCLLVGSPQECGSLESRQDECIRNFIAFFSEFFKKMDILSEPEFSKHLEAISESFIESFYEIALILGVNLKRMSRLIQADQELKQSVLYELLRFGFYYYIKENYTMTGSKFAGFFEDFNVEGLSNTELINIIEHNFAKAMKVDFSDILRHYQSKKAVIPAMLKANNELGDVFNTFIQTLRDNASQGIQKNPNLDQFVSLLTNEIYDREEMHMSGKIMSDEVLSNILVELAIDDSSDIVVDPCCGDGNLLTASYHKIKSLKEKSGSISNHNQILSQIHGIELDPNLLQLAGFKLICRDISKVNTETTTQLFNKDLFETKEINKFDAVVMNPPFLINEDVTNEIKEKYLENIESCTKETSFIRGVRQPNLYFYFVEKAVTMLKEHGNASIILMTKFLNNQDGVFLKQYLMPYVKAIISYPPAFFEGFRVTTCIVLLTKNTNNNNDVRFLKIIDTEILSKSGEVKKILNSKNNIFDEKYTLIVADKTNLKPDANWRDFLIDPQNKSGALKSLDFLAPLTNFFNILKRGCADNNGGSGIIYPFSGNNPILSDAGNIEKQFIGFGLQVNKIPNGRRKFILTSDCLEAQKGLSVPEKYDDNAPNGLSKKYSKNVGLDAYYSKAKTAVIKNEVIKWKKIVDNCYNSKVCPKIYIPRADRTKHSVYYNALKQDILTSTNFFYLDDIKNYNEHIDTEKQLEFITAWLLSCFGQIQFEMYANNQEGDRKIEKFIIEKFTVLDPRKFSSDEINNVVNEFERLNDLGKDFSGKEGIDSPRRKLDLAIGELIFRKNHLDFSNAIDLVDYYENFLMELVIDRVSI